MKLNRLKIFGLTSASLIALCGGLQAHAEETISDAIAASKPIVESNLRLETVDQVGMAKEAEALTWRNRIGFQTGEFKGVKALIEFENTAAFASDYNSTTNGKTAFPIVADPQVTELNRAQLTWAASETSTLTVGRQRIILDDARFVGNVGWRQDEQTMDAVRFDTTVGRLNVTAAYVTKINRINAETQDWDSNSYLLNAILPINEMVKLQAFNYNLDFSNKPQSSTNTLGARATGTGWLGSFKWSYLAQYANQSDTSNNPAHFDLNEYMLEGAATYDMYTFKVNYEVLEGDGKVGFITPLATVHAFQGWSDVFSAVGGNKTHVDGIKDLTLNFTIAGYTSDKLPFIKNPTLAVIYHDFKTERTGLDIGTEWDAQFTFAINPKLSVMLKHANFERASSAMPASRTKNWVMLAYKF